MSFAWPNYHLHTTFCDGKSPVAEWVEALRARGIPSAGFSSHAPLPAPITRPWAMAPADLETYLAQVRSENHQHPDIELYAGLEVDFVSGQVGPGDYQALVDYTIGSIHMAGQLEDVPWEVDMSTTLFTRGVDELFGGSYRKAVAHYYAQIRQMLIESPPSIVGHLDKIKIHNRHTTLFDEHSAWYREQVIETLHLIARCNAILEINTRGLYQQRTDEPYPSAWIIREAFSLKIPVVLSSDAHRVNEVHLFFPKIASLLNKIGYREVVVLKNGTWQPVPFHELGIQWT